jgi:H+/Cl- antiporter ClcA
MAQTFEVDFRRLKMSLLMWLSGRHWQRQSVFFLGGLAVGVAAVLLARGGDWAGEILNQILAWWPTAPLVITPLGFALSAYATRRWFDGAQGSGIPQIIACNVLPSGSQTRENMVSLRIGLGKAAMLILLLICGASIGREGPTVQIGAVVMLVAGRLGGVRREGALLLAGGAAGVAGAFNTPVAGVVFAIEELARRYQARTNSTVILAVLLAGLASLMLAGNYTYFGHSTAHISGWPDIAAVLVCGIVGGAMGGLFSQLLVMGIVRVPRLFGGWSNGKIALFAGACGLVVAVVGLLTHGATFGTGYDQAKGLIQVSHDHLSWLYGPLKLFVTLLSSMCGIPGGLFAPSLSAGAGFGAALVHVLPFVPASTVVLLGVVGYFSGVVQSPLTAFVIVSEMTATDGKVLPLMATSLLAYAVSRMVCKHPIYHAIAEEMIRQARKRENLPAAVGH